MSLELPLVIAGAFLAAVAVGIAGFADALVATAVWVYVLSPAETVPLIVATGILMHGYSVIHLRARVRLDLLWPFLLAGVIGVPLGVSLLGTIDPEPYRRFIGVFLLGYGVYALLRHRPGSMAGAGPAADAGIGFAGGVMGGFTGLSGVLPTLWAGLRGWGSDTQRGVYQPFILAMHALTLVSLARAGAVDARTGVRLLWCLPGLALGMWLGLRLYRRVDERLFRRLVIGLLMLSGAGLLIR